MSQNPNAYTSLFGMGGAVLGLFLPFWLGWAKFSGTLDIVNQSEAVTTGLVGPILMGLTGAIIVGLLGMILGMVVDGYAKKEM
mgnify:CR=1 FL=1